MTNVLRDENQLPMVTNNNSKLKLFYDSYKKLIYIYLGSDTNDEIENYHPQTDNINSDFGIDSVMDRLFENQETHDDIINDNNGENIAIFQEGSGQDLINGYGLKKTYESRGVHMKLHKNRVKDTKKFGLSEHLFELSVEKSQNGVPDLMTIEHGLFVCIGTALNELKETYGNADYFLRIVHSKIVGNINGPIWNLGENTAVE